jgi:multidrug efflux pump subunit AcrA (membrane-fusion protein)
MKHTIITAIAFAKRAYVTVLASLVLASPALSVLGGCDSPPSSPAGTETAPADLPILVRQADGRELMARVSRAQEGSIGIAKEVPLPGILEAVGQVTFDDRLVSTIISRVTGRIEELRASQWDTVRRGEPVMSLYSPDFMTAQAEYLEANGSAEESGGAGPQAGAFGLPAGGFGMTANLKAAAIRKLELLGLLPADIAAIRAPSASVWMRAPISGIIVSKNAIRGQQVNPGDQLFSLATLERVWITADIYEDDLARVKVGQNLEAVTAAYPDQPLHQDFTLASSDADCNPPRDGRRAVVVFTSGRRIPAQAGGGKHLGASDAAAHHFALSCKRPGAGRARGIQIVSRGDRRRLADRPSRRWDRYDRIFQHRIFRGSEAAA